MTIYLARPHAVEAFQMTEERRRNNLDWPSWLHDAWCLDPDEFEKLRPVDFPDSDGTDKLEIVGEDDEACLIEWDDWIILTKSDGYFVMPDNLFRSIYLVEQGFETL